MSIPLPKFDIFQGHYLGKQAVWVEAVEGMGAARIRAAQIAAEKPGVYFVFSTMDRLVLAVIDTTETPKTQAAKTS